MFRLRQSKEELDSAREKRGGGEFLPPKRAPFMFSVLSMYYLLKIAFRIIPVVNRQDMCRSDSDSEILLKLRSCEMNDWQTLVSFIKPSLDASYSLSF